MPLLFYLPNELLLPICENLDSASLNSLILTCRFFRTLLTPLLHRHAQQDVHGTPALLWAAERGHQPLISLLLEMGADINIQDRKDLITGTALHKVSIHRDEGLVRLLLENSANIEAVDQHEKTPLHLAVMEGFTGMAKLLLDHGAKVDIKDYHGTTPLQIAISRGKAEIIELLLDRGADIEAKNDIGVTPLHQAVSYGSIQIVEFLLGRGADVHARGSRGETALSLAKRHRYKKVKELVKEFMEPGSRRQRIRLNR